MRKGIFAALVLSLALALAYALHTKHREHRPDFDRSVAGSDKGLWQ
jgi:hypothetical protein